MQDDAANKDKPPLSNDSVTDHANSSAEGPLTGDQSEGPYKLKTAAKDENLNLLSESAMPNRDLLEFSLRLLEQDPSPQLFVTMTEEFCSRKLWSEAVEICRRGLVFHPNHFRGRVLLGWALWELGETGKAERLLTETRQELEKNAIIYSVLAEAAKRRGDSDQAWRFMHIYQSLVDSGHFRRPSEDEVSETQIAEPKPEEIPEALITETQEEEPRAELVAEPQEAETLEELVAEPKLEEVSDTVDAKPLREEPSALFGFLSALQSNYEQKQIETVPKPHIFADTDRKMLNEIINSDTS